MLRTRSSRAGAAALLVAGLLVTAAPGAARVASAKAKRLVGTFEVTAGECTQGAVTSGSYFRMVQTDGTVDDGPFVPNGDSACADKTYTPLTPGDDGGL